MQLFQWKHFNLENVEMITKEHEKFKPQPQTVFNVQTNPP